MFTLPTLKRFAIAGGILLAVFVVFNIGLVSRSFFTLTPQAQAEALRSEVDELKESIKEHDTSCAIGAAQKAEVTAKEKQIILLVGTGSMSF